MPSLHGIGKDKVINHQHDVPFRVLEHQYGYSSENGEQSAASGSGKSEYDVIVIN